MTETPAALVNEQDAIRAIERAEGISAPRLATIDFLRACAVIFVMLAHYTAHPTMSPAYLGLSGPLPIRVPLGGVGLSLFFMISGYCICMTAGNTGNAGHFWLRRFSRLQPAYMAAVLLTFIAVSAFGLPGRERDFPTAIANLFWLEAFPGIESIDGVYWTLIVEIKYYFLFGLLFFLLPRKTLIPSLLVIGFMGVAAKTFGHQSLSWNVLLYPHLPFFIAGVIAFDQKSASRIELAAFLSLYIIASWHYTPTLAIFLAYLLMLPAFFILLNSGRLYVPKLLRYIGLVSFPLYLVHQNIGAIAIRESAFLHSDAARIVFAISISVALAALINFAVEFRYRSRIEAAAQRLFRLGDPQSEIAL